MSAPPAHPTQRLVACLCAGWCTTCDAYRPIFAALAARHPDVRFVWVDVEDHADALEQAPGGAPDIDSFPTLLLAHGDTPVFYGTVLPHAAVLARLLAPAPASRAAARLPPEAAGWVAVVQGLAASGATPSLRA